MWAEPLLVILNRDAIDCDEVRDVVLHEWIHLQQARTHNTWDAVQAAYGGQQQAEIVADCGARLLGSELTPYLDEAGRGCTAAELDHARALTQRQAS
ncbi:hypothetical protein [Saccharomonospora iraqiensis]|uniref:hypothetical protein n=1 Tax=Saccharomonospora iraqiensis TaxID=52698 RepID=UPI00022DF884|nr:hypothetical protein [Saccharomonospora iraqiensis]